MAGLVDEMAAQIVELQAEIARLNEQLAPYLQRDEEERVQALIDSRVRKIVALLFPKYYWQLKEDEKPIRHPVKGWWWNGASIMEQSDRNSYNGTVEVEVCSYTGSGDSDKYTFVIPSEWLDLEDPTEIVHAWCIEETAKLAEEKRQKDIIEAQRKIERAAQDLADLKAKK
ncbi:MAG: hypothetical protein WC052_06020 [Patescibacteria group bacterium]